MANVDLPLVLIGPVVRRVEPRAISVFVVTSQPASIRLSLFDGIVDADASPTELAVDDTNTTRFGAAFRHLPG